jgi:glutamate racemase
VQTPTPCPLPPITKLGIFDSGVGGLTVAKSLLSSHKFESIVYYGDTARVPYGTKDEATIVKYALEAVEFFKTKDIDLLVVACNSVSAYALEAMQNTAPFKVVGVIEPGVLDLTNKIENKNAKVLITGTKATIRSQKYKEYLIKNNFTNLVEKATGLFVPIVEENIFSGKIINDVFEHYFHNIKDVEAIILGCTHFPLLENEYQKFFPNAKLIHSGKAILQYLEQTCKLKNCEKTNIDFFATDDVEQLKLVAKKWL